MRLALVVRGNGNVEAFEQPYGIMQDLLMCNALTRVRMMELLGTLTCFIDERKTFRMIPGARTQTPTLSPELLFDPPAVLVGGGRIPEHTFRRDRETDGSVAVYAQNDRSSHVLVEMLPVLNAPSTYERALRHFFSAYRQLTKEGKGVLRGRVRRASEFGLVVEAPPSKGVIACA
ncbi:hypothetical protein V8F20_011981 [Naviculisporaceae sp. PSN 640]